MLVKTTKVAQRMADLSKSVFFVDLYSSSSASRDNLPFCTQIKGKGGLFDITFISLVCFPEINDSNWFEVEIPQPDTAVSASGGKALFTGIHAENP